MPHERFSIPRDPSIQIIPTWALKSMNVGYTGLLGSLGCLMSKEQKSQPTRLAAPQASVKLLVLSRE